MPLLNIVKKKGNINMEKRIFSIILALVLCIGLSIPAFAVELKVLPSATIRIPGATNITATVTNVYERVALPLGDGMDGNSYIVFAPEGTICFSHDVVVWDDYWYRYKTAKEQTLKAGVIYNVSELAPVEDRYPILNILKGKNIGGAELYEAITSAPEDEFGGYLIEEYYWTAFVPAQNNPSILSGLINQCERDNEEQGSERYKESFLSTLIIGGSEPAPPASIAKPTSSTVLVNGKNIAFDAYNIKDNNYFKLRDLAYILSGTEKQFEVEWDGAKNAILLTSGLTYTKVGGEMTGKGVGNKIPVPTNSTIYLNGNDVAFTAYHIEGNNYFKLRDIGQTFNFSITWDGARNTIVIDTSKGYTPE